MVNLQDFFFRYTLDSTTDFLFGQSVSTQQGADTAAYDVGFSQAIDKTQAGISLGARLGPLFWLAHTPDFKRAVKKIHAYVDHFTHAAIQRRRNEEREVTRGQKLDDGKNTFLYELTRDSQDPVDLRNQVLSVLLAGRDTTASTLGWLFFILASPRYQPIFERLRAVILDEFGDQSCPSPGDISLERIKNCQYLQWCINECLRLYPAVPLNTRIAQVDTHLPTGGGPDRTDPIWVRRGEEVTYSVGPFISSGPSKPMFSCSHLTTGSSPAPLRRHLGGRRRRFQAGAVGENSLSMGVPAVQRRCADLHWPAARPGQDRAPVDTAHAAHRRH